MMCSMNKTNNACCCIFSIIASLIAAAGISAVFYTGLITSVATLIYFTLILGILGVLYLLFTVLSGGRYQCNSIKDSCLITSIVGSIVTSAFALSLTTLPTFTIAVAILIGAVAFFLITNLINLLTVFVNNSCRRCDD